MGCGQSAPRVTHVAPDASLAALEAALEKLSKDVAVLRSEWAAFHLRNQGGSPGAPLGALPAPSKATGIAAAEAKEGLQATQSPEALKTGWSTAQQAVQAEPAGIATVTLAPHLAAPAAGHLDTAVGVGGAEGPRRPPGSACKRHGKEKVRGGAQRTRAKKGVRPFPSRRPSS